MVIDSNGTPGGLASTDVTPEGFVSNSLAFNTALRPIVKKIKADNLASSTMSAAMSSSRTTSTLMT